MSAVAMKINEELNGIELYFNTKPESSVLNELKSNGFRWSGYKKCWYTKQSDSAFQVANTLTNQEVTTSPDQPKQVTKQATKKAANKVTLSLWEAAQWNDIQVNSDQDCKTVAKEIRTHIRKRFPQCKFSVTVPYYGKINFSIKSTPFEKGSIYLEAILNYCQNLIEAYRHCYSPSDSYTDYAGHYNFFGYAEIDWEYTQTEITNEIKKEIAEFDIKHAAFLKSEELKKEEEFNEYQKQQAIRNKEFKKQQEEEKKQTEFIYNNIEVKELDETSQYVLTGVEFTSTQKNNTLKDYQKGIESGEYLLEDVRVTKEIHFESISAFTTFSNTLLHDYDFLTETGGIFAGVAIYLNGKLQFIVDAQGYSYARYVGLTDNAQIHKTVTPQQVTTDEEVQQLKLLADQLEDFSTQVIEELNIHTTWQNEDFTQYKNKIIEKINGFNYKLTWEIIQQLEIESLKGVMYKILNEADSIQEQFSNADLKQGEKVTLFYISDWGSIVTHRITFDSVTNTSYAQYDNAVKLTFTPEKKRKLHYKFFYSSLLLYKGWHTLPETVLHDVEISNGMKITRSKYHSCDNKQYDEIFTHFEQEAIKPLINTYKPRF